jgi:hypothetical protein
VLPTTLVETNTLSLPTTLYTGRVRLRSAASCAKSKPTPYCVVLPTVLSVINIYSESDTTVVTGTFAKPVQK